MKILVSLAANSLAPRLKSFVRYSLRSPEASDAFFNVFGKIMTGALDPRSKAETRNVRKFDRDCLDEISSRLVVGQLGGSLVATVDLAAEGDPYFGVVYQKPAKDGPGYDYFFMTALLDEATLTSSYLRVVDIEILRGVLSKAMTAADKA